LSRPVSHQVRGAGSPRKVLQVLLAFSEKRPYATIGELAEIVGVPLSTCYRYVALLREVGLLEEGEKTTYHVTPRIMPVARSARVSNKLVALARPILERITDEVRETTVLMQPVGSLMMCVDTISAERVVRLVVELGTSMQLADGTSGKLILALWPESARNAYLSDRARYDDKFAAALPALEDELLQLADQGWGSTGPEIEVREGVWGCSAPVWEDAAPIAALAVVGPAFRIEPARRAELRNLVIEAAADITRAHESYR
jgi:DNA-binding IclR family transcriptional regulator